MYRVIKTINGHRYNYDQRTWREGGHVRCESIYVGPVDGSAPLLPRQPNPDTPQPVNTTATLSDPATERAHIARIFDPANKAERWAKPWTGGRYTSKPKWMPDKRLYQLAIKLGVRGKSSPFGGLIDRGWRKKRYEIRACYTSKNEWQIPDHSRFQNNDHATAEQNFSHTFLHEIAHATGNKAASRRALFNRFGTEAYAREEWVADLTASIVAKRMGLAPSSIGNVAWYIDSWGRSIKDKDDARAYAEREALRAADYLMSLLDQIGTPPNGTRPTEMVD